MNELLSQDFSEIAKAKGIPMVSMYISRDPGILDTKTLNEKWTEAITKAKEVLIKDYPKTFASNFLEPLLNQNVLAECETIDRGVVVFFSSHFQGYYRVQAPIQDLVIVADSFHVKPLWRIKSIQKGFFIVTMSAKSVTLYLESNGRLAKMNEYKNPAREIDVESDTNKYPRQYSNEYFSHVASEISKTLNGFKLPVILAGVKDHVGHMRKFLGNHLVLPSAIFGSVDRVRINDLREKAYHLIWPFYEQKQKEAVKDFYQALNQKNAITFIEDIATSAVSGKVKKLFVVENRQIWGRVDKKTGDVSISTYQGNSHDDDILDDICQIVLEKHGEVVVVQDAEDVKGYIAAAIVSDQSHLYQYDRAGV